ncbi:hypothetical protein Tco_0879392 [Tanacetum coccineum]
MSSNASLLSTLGDDQIDSDIIFDSPNGNVNSGSIEKDTHVPDLCALEQLTRNAYQEAEKQQIFAQKIQKQNTTLTSQLELYKERVRVLKNINGDNNYLNKFLKADKRAKQFSQQAQSQFVRDRDIIRELEKQRDKLDLDVKDYKRQNEELQKTHSILKRQMSENEDKYHDTVLDLEAKLKKNVDLILKLGNSLQGMFMLGPKPLSVYVRSTLKANDKVSSTKRRHVRDKSFSTYMQNKIRTSQIWQKWFESKPNVVWSPVNTNPNGQNSRSSEKQSFSVKKWVVKLPTCPCAVSSCVAGSSDCSVDY